MIITNRAKPCKVCGDAFLPFKTTQKVCGSDCAAAAGREKTITDNARAERRDIAARKLALKSRSDWLKDAQTAFNEFIRTRDAGLACISSGVYVTAGDSIGGDMDAGHYRSVGSAPHLRFNEDNAHGQSKHDNRYLSGNAVEYRRGLIARIGLQRVEALEADDTPRKYTIDELKTIKATYKAKTKALLAERELNGQAA